MFQDLQMLSVCQGKLLTNVWKATGRNIIETLRPLIRLGTKIPH